MHAERFFSDGKTPLLAIVEAAQNYHTKVSDAAGFRPGGSAESPALVSKIYRHWWKASPDTLHDVAKKLAAGLALTDDIGRDYCIATLLTRTASPQLSATESRVVFSRNLLVSVGNAMQISNACAHAGDYPRSPILLLSTSSSTLFALASESGDSWSRFVGHDA